jgi:hypothetical protein
VVKWYFVLTCCLLWGVLVSPVLHTGRRRSDEAELIAGEKRPESAGKSSSPLQAGVVGLFSVQRRVGKIWRGEEVTGMSTWSLGGAECSWRNAAPSDGPAGRREAAGQSVPERLQQGGRSRASAHSVQRRHDCRSILDYLYSCRRALCSRDFNSRWQRQAAPHGYRSFPSELSCCPLDDLDAVHYGMRGQPALAAGSR